MGKLSLVSVLCLAITGCTAPSPPQQEAPPAISQPDVTSPNLSVLESDPTSELPPPSRVKKLVVPNPAIDLATIRARVQTYVDTRMTNSLIESIDIKKTTVGNVDSVVGYPSAMLSPESPTWLVTIEGDIEMPEGNWAPTPLEPGLPMGAEPKSSKLYIEFSADKGYPIRFVMPKPTALSNPL